MLTAQQIGKIVGWGYNAQGQADAPSGLSNVVAVSAGGAAPGGHSVGFRVGGSVVAWGWNNAGQTNVPAGLTNAVAIAGGGFDGRYDVGSFSVALKADGTVAAWGHNGDQQTSVPAGLGGVIAISAGGGHTLALLDGGVVVSWGLNRYGQRDVPWDATNVVAVAAGGGFSLVLRQDGRVLAWGDNYGGATYIPPDLANVAAIAAGDCHSLALRSDGTVVAWGGCGSENYGQTNVPPGLSNVVAIAAGRFHSLALKRDGTVVAWGDNSAEQCDVPSDLREVKMIATERDLSLALKRDGTVVAWGDNYFGQVTMAGDLSAVMAIAAGRGHALAVRQVGIAFIVDGEHVVADAFSARGSAVVTLLSPYTGGAMLYTLDGSNPARTGLLYTTPTMVRGTAMLRAVAYNADFSQSVYSEPLALTILPDLVATTAGGGGVSIEPPEGAYFANSTAAVTATPAPGWTFLQWLGDASGTNPTAPLAMTRDKTVRAVFGTGLVTNVLGSGRIVQSPDAPLYPYGQTVRFTAVPQPGSYFVTWGTAASGTDNPLLFAVSQADPTVTAVFGSLGGPQNCALTVVCDGNGAVASLPAGNRFPRGTNVTLTALPESGQDFLGWGGDTNGTQNPLTLPLNESKIITANFTKRPQLQGDGTPEMLRDDGFRVTLTGEWGKPYQIQGSTNLLDWTPLVMLTNSYGTEQFTDGSSTNLPQRFYRAVAE